MKDTEEGFSAVEAFLVLVIVVLMGGVGYAVYNRQHKSTPLTVSTTSSTQSQSGTSTTGSTSSVPAAGTTSLINYITTQDINSESAIDAQYTTTDQTTVQSSSTAATNLGGAYNESNL